MNRLYAALLTPHPSFPRKRESSGPCLPEARP